MTKPKTTPRRKAITKDSGRKAATESWSNGEYWNADRGEETWRNKWVPLEPARPRVFREGAWDFKKYPSLLTSKQP